MSLDIRQIGPTDPEIEPLIDAHLELMHASSPACSVHAMEADDLAEAGVIFLAGFLDDQPVAMGALKPIDASHGELKSMHVSAAARGQGVGQAMLTHLVELARERGISRLSLETGSQPVFEPARKMYGAAGFVSCGPIPGYGPDINSAFYTLEL